MKRVAAVFGVLLVAGCTTPEKHASAESEEKTNYYQPDSATAATVEGLVRFTGKQPPARRLSMQAEEACESLHDGPVVEPSLITAKDGALTNAFVYLKTGLEGKQFEPPTETVLLDQRGCMFVPRVVALRAGQTLSIKNSDPVSHNIHPQPQLNREWNQHQAPDAPDLQRRFVRPEVLIPVKCNVHSWMRSYISVLDHPYFAVTGGDGRFSWTDVPPGEYTVAVWHETLGELTQSVVLAANGKEVIMFTFDK
jgi:hypothetical protein